MDVTTTTTQLLLATTTTQLFVFVSCDDHFDVEQGCSEIFDFEQDFVRSNFGSRFCFEG